MTPFGTAVLRRDLAPDATPALVGKHERTGSTKSGTNRSSIERGMGAWARDGVVGGKGDEPSPPPAPMWAGAGARERKYSANWERSKTPYSPAASSRVISPEMAVATLYGRREREDVEDEDEDEDARAFDPSRRLCRTALRAS
jgi:hypothetical protein